MRALRGPWQLIWAVLQLGWQLGQLQVCPDQPGSPLTFLPAQLRVSEGTDATFWCGYPNMSKPAMLNWYRGSPSNQSVKLAAFPRDAGERTHDQRFSITQLGDRPAFQLHIRGVVRNDSGPYYCGAIDLRPKTQITESPCAELTVTERASTTPAVQPSPAPRPQGQLQALVISITGILVGVLVLLLLFWVLATVLPKGTQAAGGGRSSSEPVVSPSPLTADTVPGSAQGQVEGCRGQAEGGSLLCAHVHHRLRRAGLPVAREDPRAPRWLLPRADRVRHHCVP